MRAVVVLLYVLGGVLPVLGVVLARRSIRRQAERSDHRRRQRAALIEQSRGLPIDEQQLLFERAGIPWISWHDVMALPEFQEAAILRHALSDLRGPALITLAGVVSGTVASVWSLYL